MAEVRYFKFLYMFHLAISLMLLGIIHLMDRLGFSPFYPRILPGIFSTISFPLPRVLPKIISDIPPRALQAIPLGMFQEIPGISFRISQ